MKKSAWMLATLATILGMAAADRKNWVLLIAGSQTYENYRHQASICHAYHIVSANGIPDEQIVVMMYDDIAYNAKNPVQGNLINEPGGPNVYPGVPKDYNGTHVNAAVFLAVLQGDVDKVKNLTGKNDPKVIASGPDDYLFVNYVDHGGPGILAMPVGDFLYATDLNKALQNMYDEQKYAKLVFYMEACESGSMFDGILPENINIYATTAANPTESSWACYCEPDDDGRGTCLGSYYSVNWMQNCDDKDIHTETLQTQYEIVKNETTKSHVTQYGDRDLVSLNVSEFLSNRNASMTRPLAKMAASNKSPVMNSMLSEEVGIFTLKQLLEDPLLVNRRDEIRSELEEKLRLQTQTAQLFSKMAGAAYPNQDIDWVVNTRSSIKQRSAYEYAVRHLVTRCPKLQSPANDFAVRGLNTLVNLTNRLSLAKVLGAVELATRNSPLC